MRIQEYLDRLESWEGEDREKYIRPLLRMLSMMSVSTFVALECGRRDRTGLDYEAFKNLQNRVLLRRLKIETSEDGRAVREELGLPPLTVDTDVEIAGESEEEGGAQRPHFA